MIILDKRKYERIVSELIDAKDIRELVERYSLDRIYYYHILKDISLGERSPNHKLLRKIAHRRKLSEDFVMEQAKSVLNYFLPYYQSFQTDSLDYYRILNVTRNATDEEIRRSWIELMKAHHPDKVGAGGLDTSKKINEAYEALSSASKREAYDNRHLPPTPVIVPQNDMKKYYLAGAFMVVIFLVVMYASGSGLIFQSPEEKERLAREFEAPDMPNTVYKGDYLDPEEVDKKISEIKPIEQAGQAEQAEQAQAKRSAEKTTVKENEAPKPAVTEEKPAPEKKTEIAKAGPADETPAGDMSGNPGMEDVTETLPAEELENEALEPGVEKKIEITEVTPDAPDKEAQPVAPAAPAEVKPAEKETFAAKSEEAPAPAAKVAEKSPESPAAVETVQKPSPKEEVLTAKSESVKEEQEPAAEIKKAEKVKEPEIELAEKPAAIVKPAIVKPEAEPVEVPAPEKENAPLPGEYYTVRQGDSLWSIAQKFGKTAGELESLNGLSDSRLRIGDKILISGEGVTPPKPVTEVAVKKAEPVPVPAAVQPKKEITPAPVVAKAAAPVKPPVKTNITADFNPELATSAVAVRDTSVRVPEPIPPAAAPDRDSVYGFVTDYVSAYKNKDLDRVKALFMPDAVENGVSISRVINSYSSNFSNLDIMKYDVRVSGISVDKSLGYVRGEFFITFKDQRTGALKSSKGHINWTLSWTEGSWKIRELTYKIENTDTVG